MTAKLNRRLNLVVPIETAGGTFYAHAAPIPTEQFAKYCRVLATTFAQIYKGGLGVVAGPRVAAMLLREVAQELDQLEAVETGLMTDLRRLTNILGETPSGWQTIPMEDALRNNLIDAEDVSEVENAVAFFTLAWHMHRKSERAAVLASAAVIWNAQLSPLSCTDYLVSLQTSKTTDASTSKPE